MSPAPEKYPFTWEEELVERAEDKPAFLGARVQSICELVEYVTKQSLPSTVTVLLVVFGEKPFPMIERYCPPTLPDEGVTEVMVGNEANSKY